MLLLHSQINLTRLFEAIKAPFFLLCPVLTLSLSALAVATPKPFVAEPTYDFGSVAQGQKVVHEFAIRNDGDTDLVIQRVSPACGCTAAAMSAAAVKPGATEKIRVTFDTAGFYGLKTKSVSVVTNVPSGPEIVLQLKGSVVLGVSLDPERLDFGELPVGASEVFRSRELMVRPSAEGGREVAGVTTVSRNLTVQAISEQGGTKRYKVTLIPNLPKGEIRDRLLVEFKDPGHAAVNVPVIASIIGDVRIVPATVSFGIAQGTALIERRIRFENNSPTSVTIQSIKSSHPAVTASSVEVEPGKRAVIVVKLDPTKITGDLKATLEVKTSHPTENSFVVSLYGVAVSP